VQKEQLPDRRLGERISLSRIATPAVLMALVGDADARVLAGCLENPRLREADLLTALRSPDVRPVLLEAAAEAPRWQESYAVHLALVLSPRCPLGIALAQISSLLSRDLARVADTDDLAPLVRAAALRVARERPMSPGRPGRPKPGKRRP
jgi:hypothetical protein